MILFKKRGWIYIPVHIGGYIVTLLAIAFMIPILMAAIRNEQSISDTLYHLFVYATCTAFWWKWVADKTVDNEQ